jgi:hypothetical protein
VTTTPRRAPAARAIAILVLIALGGTLRARPQQPGATAAAPAEPRTDVTLEPVLATASGYVAHFIETFVNVVGEERYTQDVVTGGSLLAGGRGAATGPTHRELRSDFLLIHTGGPLEWVSFRDVFEVDGKPVRDRVERLTTLFDQPAPTALDQAARLTQESARYNIGAVERTINTPVLPLLFLQSGRRDRFRFTRAMRTTDFSDRVTVLAYREVTRPTIIRTVRDTDRPASGRFWIEAETGRVLQTELVLTGNGVNVRLTTTFRPDDRLGVAVPVKMREEYSLPSGRLVGQATYEGFRRFEVRTDMDVLLTR